MNYLNETGHFLATCNKVKFEKKNEKSCIIAYYSIDGKMTAGKYVDYFDKQIQHTQNYFLRKNDGSVNHQTLALLSKCFDVELKKGVDPEIEMKKMLGQQALLKIGTWSGSSTDKKFYVAKETLPVPEEYAVICGDTSKKSTGEAIMFDDFPF